MFIYTHFIYTLSNIYVCNYLSSVFNGEKIENLEKMLQRSQMKRVTELLKDFIK